MSKSNILKNKRLVAAVSVVLLAFLLVGIVAALPTEPSHFQDDADGDNIPNELDDCVSSGDTLGFGIKNNGCPANDADSDLVPNRFDSCAHQGMPTAANEYIQNDGCLADDGPLTNSDLDYIPDSLDDCDSSPNSGNITGLGVLGNGCQVTDSDGDNMPNDLDSCAHQAGFPFEWGLNNDGCEIPDSDNDDIPNPIDNCPYTAGPWEDPFWGCADPSAVQIVQFSASGGSVVESFLSRIGAFFNQ